MTRRRPAQAALALRLYRFADHPFARLREAGNVLFGGSPAQTDAKRPVGQAGVDAHGGEHVRSPRPCRTSRPSRTTGRRPPDRTRSAPSPPSGPGMAKAKVFGRRSRPLAEDHGVGSDGQERRLGLVRASRRSACRLRARGRAGPHAAAAPKPAMAGDVLGPGPAAPLLPAAADEAVGRSRAGRTARTMARRPWDRRACGPRASGRRRRARGNVDRRSCRRPGRRRMQERRRRRGPARATAATGWMTPVSLLASLERDQDARVRSRATGAPSSQSRSTRPSGRRGSLDGVRPESDARRGRSDARSRRRAAATAARAPQPPEAPGAERDVVGLGAAAGEHDRLAGAAPTRRGDRVPRRLDQRPGRPALGMDRRRVARQLGARAAPPRRLRPQGRGGVVVEVGTRSVTCDPRPWHSGRRARNACNRPGCRAKAPATASRSGRDAWRRAAPKPARCKRALELF